VGCKEGWEGDGLAKFGPELKRRGKHKSVGEKNSRRTPSSLGKGIRGSKNQIPPVEERNTCRLSISRIRKGGGER